MPYELDDVDIGIIKSLQADGRKSFRQISRELEISTPTIQSRYQRLVNIGLIKSIEPIIDSSMLENSKKERISEHCHPSQTQDVQTGMSVKMICNYCDGPIGNKPQIFKFENYERFFCCNTCKSQYKEKYKGRIDSLLEKAKDQK